MKSNKNPEESQFISNLERKRTKSILKSNVVKRLNKAKTITMTVEQLSKNEFLEDINRELQLKKTKFPSLKKEFQIIKKKCNEYNKRLEFLKFSNDVSNLEKLEKLEKLNNLTQKSFNEESTRIANQSTLTINKTSFSKKLY